MSFTIDKFDDTTKWLPIQIEQAVVTTKLADSFKAVVNIEGDMAGLVSTLPQDLTECDLRVKVNRQSARTCLYICPVQDLANPMPDETRYFWAIIRDFRYGILIYQGYGFPYVGSDPISPDQPAELRITVSGGILTFYYNGAQIYSQPLTLISPTSLFVYLLSCATSYNTTIAGTSTFLSMSYVPPSHTLTIASYPIGGIPVTIEKV